MNLTAMITQAKGYIKAKPIKVTSSAEKRDSGRESHFVHPPF
jgi:hypothetical protein